VGLGVAAACIMPCGAQVAKSSAWDRGLLSVRLANVNIAQGTLVEAWQHGIVAKCLIRSVLYYDAKADSGGAFVFKRNSGTGKDLLDAFIAAYPAYTYTQDPITGVLWLHPQSTRYDDILKDIVTISRRMTQVRMHTDVLRPVCRLLSPAVLPAPEIDDYPVDLPSGAMNLKQILNRCCACNPTKSFLVGVVPPGRGLREGTLVIHSYDCIYDNPIAPPRNAALVFWDSELGPSTNGIPSLEDIRSAMADPDPHSRWAAKMYYRATRSTYSTRELVKGSDRVDTALWTALALERWLSKPLLSLFQESLTATLSGVRDPCLALVASLELATEGKTNSFLDSVVTNHFFNTAEVARIESDVYRHAHESTAALDKLKVLGLGGRGFGSNIVSELALTNQYIFASPTRR
jgi:hypothetical protein